MTVQQLVELLETFEPELEVLIYCDDCTQEFNTESTKVVEENKEVVIYI